MAEPRSAHVHLELFYNSYFLPQAEQYRGKTGTTGKAPHIQAKYPTKRYLVKVLAHLFRINFTFNGKTRTRRNESFS